VIVHVNIVSCHRGRWNPYRESGRVWESARATDLASLVLGDLVLGVLAAVLALAVGLTGLGNVDLYWRLLVSLWLESHAARPLSTESSRVGKPMPPPRRTDLQTWGLRYRRVDQDSRVGGLVGLVCATSRQSGLH
jgi:hypothetical protein